MPTRQKLYIFVAITIFFILFAASPCLSQWQGTSGPPGGEVKKIIIHPKDASIIYVIVSSPFSGVFKSTDGGNFWEALTNGLDFDLYNSKNRAPQAFAIDISNPETLYVAINQPPTDGPSFLYRSTNGGASWSPIKRDIIISLWADKGEVFALSESGLLFSSDAGNSWVLQNGSLHGNEILMDDQKILWVGGNKGLFRSEDFGKTYQKFVFPNMWDIQAFDVAIVNNQKLIAVSVAASPAKYDSFYVSYDEGATWTSRTTTLPYEPSLESYSIPLDVRISRQDIDHIFAGLPEGFYRTTNGGQNWEQQNSGLAFPRAILPYLTPVITCLSVSQEESNLIIAGTINHGVFRSTNEGMNWQFLSVPSGKVVRLSVSKNSSRVFAASSGGVYSFDGRVWTPTTMLIGDIIGRLKDIAVSPHNPRLILCSVEKSMGGEDLYRSSDEGLTWTRIAGGYMARFGKIIFDPVDTSRVYALTKVSDDQGDSWHYLSMPTGGRPIDMAINPLDNKILYILRQDGMVDRSSDRGVTWTQVRASTDSLYNAVIRIDPRNPNTIYVGSSKLFKSVDSGAHWIRMPFDKKITDIVFDPETGELFLGTLKEGVWRSPDGGNTFTKLPSLPSERIVDLLFYVRNQRKFLLAGTYGVGVYQYDLGPTLAVPTDRNFPQRFYLSQNYPNPFNAETRITYELPNRGKVLVQVFNVLGKKIKTLVNRDQFAGSHSIHWDGTDEMGVPVSSGLYFYTLNFDGNILARKMMYLK